MIVIIWTLVLVTAVWLYFKQAYSVFSKYGVKQLTPFPLVGNMLWISLKMEHASEHFETIYNAFPDERGNLLDAQFAGGIIFESTWIENIVPRFVGRFEFGQPVVMIRDIELLKKIAVKDFEHFIDHRTIINEEVDPLFGRNLFSLKGQEWKDMRSTLSPAFTSSKIKLMVPFMVEVGDQMIKALKKKVADSGAGYIDVDCKDLTTRYANDVVASCAFGLKVDSMMDEENHFYVMGKEASSLSFRQILMVFCFSSFPKFMKTFGINLFSKATQGFFRNLVLGTMNDREERNIIRPDMINILMEAKKGKLTHDDKSNDADAGFATVEESTVGKKNIDRVWSDDDLVAQALLFFLAGFDTVSIAMSFLLHEVAINPDVQEKLYQEIKDNEVKNGGKFDYNSIQKLEYLDKVVSEVLRLWPPVLALDRLCVKDYNMGKPNDKAKKEFILRKGTLVALPMWPIHRDPKIYPNPLKFDPERFSEENKHKINPFTYMPFGLGPRNCIGSRFALCEVKIMAYQLLQHMELSPSEKTCIPGRLSRDNFNPRMHGGHWVRMRARD